MGRFRTSKYLYLATAFAFLIFQLWIALGASADTKKCLASRLIAKAWLPAEGGVNAVQKWNKSKPLKVRIITDNATIKNDDVKNIEIIRGQFSRLLQGSGLTFSVGDNEDEAKFSVALTRDVDSYLEKHIAEMSKFLFSGPLHENEVLGAGENRSREIMAQTADVFVPAVIAKRVHQSGGCGSFYVAYKNEIVASYSIIDVGRSILCSQVALSEALGAWNAPTFTYSISSDEKITEEDRAFFLTASVAQLYSDKVEIGSARADAKEAIEGTCQ